MKTAFRARLLQLGYTHKFFVAVQEILFEPDEEQTHSAVVAVEQMLRAKAVDVELIRAIAAGIEALLR